jgi:PIN domain nuclease of toxin-antitoxin system
MLNSVVIDTQVLVWHLIDPPAQSPAARQALIRARETGGVIAYSVISLVEIAYLMERRRLPGDILDAVEDAQRHPDNPFVPLSVTPDVANALRDIPRETVPDMPDRIIAATALHLGLPLVTCDERIRRLPITTIW